MPYNDLNDLPKTVREHLPKHAQEIYRAAFNSAWNEYAQDEEQAHRVAWGAVKHKYEKAEFSGQWKAKDIIQKI
jgi:cation transport regulator